MRNIINMIFFLILSGIIISCSVSPEIPVKPRQTPSVRSIELVSNESYSIWLDETKHLHIIDVPGNTYTRLNYGYSNNFIMIRIGSSAGLSIDYEHNYNGLFSIGFVNANNPVHGYFIFSLYEKNYQSNTATYNLQW